MDRVKSKINSSGIDGITEQELIEMEYWTCVANNMTSYDYHYKIIEEMEKPENKYGVNYDENGKFYTQPRNSMGQFTKRGYDELYDPTMKHNMEMSRDMDYRDGKMFYTDVNNMHHSQYARARRGFEEAKNANPNAEHMHSLETMMDSLDEEMKELKPKMTSNERSVARNKLTTMANSMM